MNMEHSWRWYGPSDPVIVADIRQAGATGVFMAMREITIG
jgi:mannonate dehydratase